MYRPPERRLRVSSRMRASSAVQLGSKHTSTNNKDVTECETSKMKGGTHHTRCGAICTCSTRRVHMNTRCIRGAVGKKKYEAYGGSTMCRTRCSKRCVSSSCKPGVYTRSTTKHSSSSGSSTSNDGSCYFGDGCGLMCDAAVRPYYDTRYVFRPGPSHCFSTLDCC